MEHIFKGKWISNDVFSQITPRNVFHRQLDKLSLDCTEHRNRHILFRKHFDLTDEFQSARIFISADDYYKLYVNGAFVAQGPAPAYHFQYNYNEIDITEHLNVGENVIAVHTFYQGLINRVWQSGDHRHGLICDIVVDGVTVVSSDESFLAAIHSGYGEMGVCGYQTQFLERYDSGAREVGFESVSFDDSYWSNAKLCRFDDHLLTAQSTYRLVFETVAPVEAVENGNRLLLDFGANYVGYLAVKARGAKGSVITVRCAQELDTDGAARYDLRANCKYEEQWVLSDTESMLSWFDYKAFRYAELELPVGAEIINAELRARHYPFELKASISPRFSGVADVEKIWELCVHTQKYGVQEVVQDCMEREKGFYLGDGCYTALTHMVLTEDDTMVRKLIDDAFATDFITDTLVTCLDCSFMQEIAEFPLILTYLVLWHYRFTRDAEYLRINRPKVIKLLEAYRKRYEKDGVLRDLDKWCVVEWPKNFQHGYDVEIAEGRVCTEAHVSLNAYYLYAVRCANIMSEIVGAPRYRDETALCKSFTRAFYDSKSALFRDGENTDHISLVGNVFVYAFGLYPNSECRQKILDMIDQSGIESLSLFCTFITLMGFVRHNDTERLRTAFAREGAWRRMLSEGASTTFEGWGRDTKWNTSLFHMTMSYGALFLADVDLKSIFK